MPDDPTWGSEWPPELYYRMTRRSQPGGGGAANVDADPWELLLNRDGEQIFNRDGAEIEVNTERTQ